MMMAMRCSLRLEQRLELRAPTPPEAVRGIEGLKVADEVLKKYKVTGMLVGGLAKEAWRGSSDPADFSKHKDVDVLVLARGCGKHPGQWEDGVDWWISHKAAERPTNGTSVGLVWRVSLKRNVEIAPGLYVCPLELLEGSIKQEKRTLGNEFVVHGDKFSAVALNKFPVLSAQYLRVKWGDDGDDVASHCKPH